MAAPRRTDRGETPVRDRLLHLIAKHLERFVGMVPKFLVNDDPKLIHDLRVGSRRLQQTLRASLPRPKNRQAKKVVKVLRDVRRSLGDCRNLDVTLALARDRADASELPETNAAWAVFIEALSADRGSMVDPARRRIRKQDLSSLIAHIQDLLEDIDSSDDSLRAYMRRSLRRCLAAWDQAYATAHKTRETEDLHALRIAGKRLRYRADLLADVGIDRLKPMAKDLKAIQDALGDWHDRFVMTQSIAEFVQRKFVAHHATTAAALLAEIEKEQKRSEALINRFFTETPALRKRWRELKQIKEGRKKRAAGSSN